MSLLLFPVLMTGAVFANQSASTVQQPASGSTAGSTTAQLTGLASTAVAAASAAGTAITTSAVALLTAATASEIASAPQYDASIGAGVDASGFAKLPLRNGASRYFVNSAKGSDKNSCDAAKNPATPKATITAGVACMAATGKDYLGPGDQLMIAEGTRYADGPGIGLTRKAGYSALYPAVIQSYDPADPFNEASHGRAGTAGHKARPVLNTGGTLVNMGGVHADKVNYAYLAIRGLDWNPGNVARSTWNFNGGMDYLLFENNIIRYTQVNLNGIKPTVHHILRKNTLYGAWSDTGHSQCLYDDTVTGVTLEDNIIWHCGWKIGVSRDMPENQGGATMYNHAVYLQTKTYDVTIRRNVIVDPSSHGVQARGGATVSRNVYIDNPIAQLLGGGTDYATVRASGVPASMTRNLILGDADITSTLPRGIGIWTTNTTAATQISDNMIVRSRTGKATPFVSSADYNTPTYATYSNNLIYRYGTAGTTGATATGAFAKAVVAKFTSNVWDAPDTSTNRSSASVAFSTPVTAQDIYTYLGCGSKQGCLDKMIETPDQGWADRIRLYAFKSYGR